MKPRRNNPMAVLALLMASCSSDTVGPPPTAPANWQSLHPRPVPDAGPDIVTARERMLPDAYASALTSPGLASLGPLLDDEAHFASPGMDDAHGRDAIVRAHDVLFGAFDDRKIGIARVWRTAGEQTIEWTMTAAQGADWLGVPATHKPVAFKGLTLLWTKDDGTISDCHVYFDVAVVKAQLGSGPKEFWALPPVQLPAGPAQVYEQTQAVAPADKQPASVVQSWLDALENNNEAAYAGAVTEDLELYTQDRAQPARGKEAAKSYFKAMHRAIGQLDTTTENKWNVTSYSIVEYSIAGEQLGPLGWVPSARDRVIRLEVVDICEIADGKIARVWRYDNPAEIAAGPPAAARPAATP